jgi:hypothetical protein
MVSWMAKLPRVAKTWQPVLILAGGAIGALVGAGWTMWVHRDEIADGKETHKIEVQLPFLQKRLQVYFSAIEAARKLTDSHLSPDSSEWKDNATNLWELRWGELEMVGDKGTREAARRVDYKILDVEAAPNDDTRRQLRWAVECLADEMRLSLEASWGFDPSAVRQTALGRDTSTVPAGCTDSGRLPDVPDGMPKIVRRGQVIDPHDQRTARSTSPVQIDKSAPDDQR